MRNALVFIFLFSIYWGNWYSIHMSGNRFRITSNDSRKTWSTHTVGYMHWWNIEMVKESTRLVYRIERPTKIYSVINNIKIRLTFCPFISHKSCGQFVIEISTNGIRLNWPMRASIGLSMPSSATNIAFGNASRRTVIVRKINPKL